MNLGLARIEAAGPGVPQPFRARSVGPSPSCPTVREGRGEPAGNRGARRSPAEAPSPEAGQPHKRLAPCRPQGERPRARLRKATKMTDENELLDYEEEEATTTKAASTGNAKK